MALLNLVTSKFSVKERWIKLYRVLYREFFLQDFVHKQDYLQTIAALNARITAAEAATAGAIQASAAAVNAAVSGHTHATGVGPSGPGIPAVPTVIAPPAPAPPAQHLDTFHNQRNALLQSLGPAIAPLGDGIGVEAQQATVTAREDIGV